MDVNGYYHYGNAIWCYDVHDIHFGYSVLDIYILPSLYVDIMQYDGILQYEGNGINHGT